MLYFCLYYSSSQLRSLLKYFLNGIQEGLLNLHQIAYTGYISFLLDA